MKLGKEGWVLRSRAARGRIQSLRRAQTPRKAERNLGTRSTKKESVSFRIATFRKALIKLGSQLPQRLMGCCTCDVFRRSRIPKSLSGQNIAAARFTQPSSVPESRFHAEGIRVRSMRDTSRSIDNEQAMRRHQLEGSWNGWTRVSARHRKIGLAAKTRKRSRLRSQAFPADPSRSRFEGFRPASCASVARVVNRDGLFDDLVLSCQDIEDRQWRSASSISLTVRPSV
jgi:hypothetical protein